ncbi:MAG: ABC transporter ATP-binding protein [Crocinitomicaceae bacterium]|nr:ABC transporter ATP-binding protein [Crocinitomicaceae bacterium]
MSELNLFSCENLLKRYPSGNFELGPINLKLAAGEITGVVGENGNGKTTLLRIIAGELSHDSGTMKYFGDNPVEFLTWENIHSRVAYIPQRIPKWYGYLRTNLQFQASVLGIKRQEANRQINELIDVLGLNDYADLKWSEISTGYRLRFQLAKMLIGNPELLVLDEPIANLDINAQAKFLNDLRIIATGPNRNVSVILSSQQLHEIENVSDNVVFLRAGKMVFSGDVKKLGEEREFNEFEVTTTLGMDKLKEMHPEVEFEQTGKMIYVKTDLKLSAEDFITSILSAGGKITYFRDISASTRKLFKR